MTQAIGLRLTRRLIAGILFGCIAWTAGAEGQTRYLCKFGINGQNRAHLSENMVITVSEAGWRVLVDDALIEKAMGRPVKAEVGRLERGRISFDWTLLLKKNAGSRKVTFHMTIFPTKGEASVSANWSKGWSDSFTATAQGKCKPA